MASNLTMEEVEDALEIIIVRGAAPSRHHPSRYP